MSLKYQYLADKGVKVAALSCNELGEHQVGCDQLNVYSNAHQAQAALLFERLGCSACSIC
jgi:hypothetical protein